MEGLSFVLLFVWVFGLLCFLMLGFLWPRVTSNSCLLSAEIADVCHHTWPLLKMFITCLYMLMYVGVHVCVCTLVCKSE